MILEVLNEQLKKVLDKLNYQAEEIKIIKSNRPDLCDYQYDGIFKLASVYHQSPIEIGIKIEEELKKIDNFNNYFDKVEFVKPGFLNINISNKLINDILIYMNNNEKLGLKQPEKKETYFLDYGGPNIAKPLHVGHMRSAIVGESVKRIIDYMGHKTISDVHLGDFGLQIGQVIYGIIKYNKNINEIDLDFLDKIYPEISLLSKQDEQIKEQCANITKDLQDGNDTYIKYWKKICEISGNDIKRIYKYLDVNFDLWYGESDAYKYILEVEKIIESQNLFEISQNAKIIDIKEKTDTKELPPLIFQKSNKAYLYGTTDIATIYQRMNDYNPDHILYFADARQSLHFTQVFRACKKSNISKNVNLEFLGFGTVNGLDGKPYKTRSGDAPKLDDLFNEVKEIFISKKESNKEMLNSDIDKIVNAILKFADLQNNREKDYIFDIAKFSEVVGKTGPYILYTYLRINKMVLNENVENISQNIYNNYDRELRKKMIEFDLSLNNAFKEKAPSIIAEYIYDLCVLLNTFYQNNHINGLNNDLNKTDWIYILKLSTKVLKEMFNLLMIDVPTKM
ncbi:MAG: arginine--tRNA ligase [Bacilli bacterium]|nr:arginine--tRNA ligase [Bacilli bacterium]